MTTTDHAVTPDEVMALLDGELSPAEEATVSMHVASCTECSALAGELRQVSASLAGWTVEEIPGRVDDGVLRGVERGSGWLDRLGWRPWMVWVGGAAFASVFLVVLGSLEGSKRTAPESALSDGRLGSPNFVLSDTDEMRTATPQVAGVAGMGVMGDGSPTAVAVTTHTERTSRLAAQATVQAVPGPMIARNVSMTMEVKDVEVARAAVEGILVRHHGYAATLNVYTAERQPRRVRASLRVPAGELAGTITELRALGRVQDETQAGEEVSEQHADLVARLKTARATEESFRGILRQRTGTVADVMNVQEGIERIRGEIERMETAQMDLEHRVAFASVGLELAEREARVQPGQPVVDSVSLRVHRALAAGYGNVTGSVLGFLLLVMEYGPVLLVWAALLGVPIFFLVWWRWKRVRRGIR